MAICVPAQRQSIRRSFLRTIQDLLMLSLAYVQSFGWHEFPLALAIALAVAPAVVLAFEGLE
jgi:hypothetical protein